MKSQKQFLRRPRTHEPQNPNSPSEKTRSWQRRRHSAFKFPWWTAALGIPLRPTANMARGGGGRNHISADCPNKHGPSRWCLMRGDKNDVRCTVWMPCTRQNEKGYELLWIIFPDKANGRAHKYDDMSSPTGADFILWYYEWRKKLQGEINHGGGARPLLLRLNITNTKHTIRIPCLIFWCPPGWECQQAEARLISRLSFSLCECDDVIRPKLGCCAGEKRVISSWPSKLRKFECELNDSTFYDHFLRLVNCLCGAMSGRI